MPFQSKLPEFAALWHITIFSLQKIAVVLNFKNL